jgi:hypothetical protein
MRCFFGASGPGNELFMARCHPLSIRSVRDVSCGSGVSKPLRGSQSDGGEHGHCTAPVRRTFDFPTLGSPALIFGNPVANWLLSLLLGCLGCSCRPERQELITENGKLPKSRSAGIYDQVSGDWLNPDLVVYRFPEPLFAAEIFLCRLH